MFKDLGIKGRVLLLTLLPTSLLAMVLGGYFTWVQLSDMRAQLIERGQLIAEQLAPLAATALARKDTAVLNRIANEALDQPDVRAVTFLDARQERLAHAGPSMLTVAPAGDASHLSMSTELDTTHFLLPVLGRHHSLSGATEPDDERVLGWVELELSHHGTLLRGYRSLFTSLLLIAAGLGVTALLALRMSRAINAPLELISQGVAQLKEGRMETRLPPMGSNELDELASGINRMAETLQSAQEEMQHNIDQATEDVRQNLETIEIQNIELDLARKEALEASRIKSEFLANMSHEIRTPLNGILGFTNLLQKSELSPRQQDYLTTIQKSAESLLGIINEILDFSKIEAGKLVLENLPFNLRDLIQDALTMLAPAAHEKQLELVSLVYRDTPIQLQGDPQRLKQILTNLVGNAIKFTQGGTVAVRAMLEDESDDRAQLRISVQDTGIGLSEEDQQALFKAFSQADNSLSRQAGGTGLGLVISKRLIEQMGGEIGVDLHGKRVGVIGTGQIGETFARIMAGFGCELLAYDPYPNPRIQALGGRYLALDALLAESDIVSLHCPLTADTRHLIDAQRLATMKPGAMLINTGRGALVNAAALIEALKSGQLGYLGLDVYEEEADIFFEDRSDQPLQDDVLARLLSFPNVVVTAHQAFLTREALAAIADTTLDNIAAWQDGTPRNRVRA
ncbi:TPA: HAMP domain-containing protein [Pseudomonas aeruginosa]|nr:HAMP domain-containing protein [Pseudomonas aeruginosa]